MKDNCELCPTPLTAENIHILVLIDDTYGEVLNELEVCDVCSKHYEFTIGAVEWEEEK